MEYTKDTLIDFSMVNNLIELGGDDGKEFLKEIIDLYIGQYPELFEGIKSNALNNENVPMYQSAHALKGASLNVGAKEIASICKEIEMKGKENDMTQIPELIKTLEIVYPLTINELKKLY
jgi:HPt (histidine-containing phosphotransfer) domain-containing protein